MTTALIPVFAGTLQSQSVQLCDARTLHIFMGVLRDFSNWIKGRISKFGFVEGVDYLKIENLSSPDLASAKSRAQKLTDYHLTIDMAKELSMVENNDKGREARRYFIECERKVYESQPSTTTVTPFSHEHIAAATDAASKVFGSVLRQADWKHSRHLVEFVSDSKFSAPAMVQPLDWSDCILKYEELPKLIKAQDNMLGAELVASIGYACFDRLSSKISGLSESNKLLRAARQ